MQILSPHHENTKLEKILTIEKMTPQGGTLGPAEVEKFCVEILQTNYIYIRSSYGVLITKNTKLEKFSTIEKMTPHWAFGGPKNANFSAIEFRPEPPMFFIYILVVYEEYLLKASKFNIRKISRVRIFVVTFCFPKLPLGSTARADCFIRPSSRHHQWTWPITNDTFQALAQ